jgi:RNA polymerase sigma factor (sigma-70 family)
MAQPSASLPDRIAAARPEWIAAVLDEARAGRREALGRLVVEFSPVLWQVARAAGLDRSACEDVVQTTWLRLLDHLDGILNPAALVGWLVTVARREAWRARGAGQRERPVEPGVAEPADTDPEPGERLLVDERRRVLWDAVRRLPRRCQDLLRIVAFVHRPDYAVVAGALDMPTGSIGPTRGRCLAKLRHLLAADPHWSTR